MTPAATPAHETTLAGAGSRAGASGAVGAFVRAGRAVRWYMRGITRADAYERYVDHLQRTHPEAPIPSERQFWRERYAEMEADPSSRCC